MKSLVLIPIVLITALFGQAPDAAATLILHRGEVWTGEADQPWAEAVAIRGNRIAAVGANRKVLQLRGPKTQLIDLSGKFVTPGFNDNHTHFASAAQFLEFNIMKTGYQAEFVKRVREVAATLGPGDWITGGGWGAYDQWTSGSSGGKQRQPFTPDMSQIEPWTRDLPVFIWKFDQSEYAVNRAALVALGLNSDAPALAGVEFLSKGLLKGPGVRELLRRIPQSMTRPRRVRQTLRALEEIRRYGVTNISDMSDELQLEIFRELHLRGQLTVRVHFRYQLADWKRAADQGIRVGSGDPWIRFGAVKGHIDGIMGTSTARFLEPYSNDPSSRGRWRPLMVDGQGDLVPGKFVGILADADRAGLQLSVHAIGDEANRLLLDYLEELDRRNGKKDRRFRLVHAQVVAGQDFPRFRGRGIIAEVQPFHLADDMRWMEERIGHERSRGAYAFHRLAESGARLSFGTDWPGTTAAEYPINPMLGLYAAIARQTLAGQPPSGWFPGERLSMEEALRAYTSGSAYANFEEDVKGTIRTGKLADLTVLSRNLMRTAPREIPKTEVVYTIVDGKVVYGPALRKLQDLTDR